MQSPKGRPSTGKCSLHPAVWTNQFSLSYHVPQSNKWQRHSPYHRYCSALLIISKLLKYKSSCWKQRSNPFNPGTPKIQPNVNKSHRQPPFPPTSMLQTNLIPPPPPPQTMTKFLHIINKCIKQAHIPVASCKLLRCKTQQKEVSTAFHVNNHSWNTTPLHKNTAQPFTPWPTSPWPILQTKPGKYPDTSFRNKTFDHSVYQQKLHLYQ